jgi:outer membrane murein-binding lipoprotein Lpp
MRLVVTAAVLAAVLLGGCTPSRGKTVYDKARYRRRAEDV